MDKRIEDKLDIGTPIGAFVLKTRENVETAWDWVRDINVPENAKIAAFSVLFKTMQEKRSVES